jgi:hypothetical protein
MHTALWRRPSRRPPAPPAVPPARCGSPAPERRSQVERGAARRWLALETRRRTGVNRQERRGGNARKKAARESWGDFKKDGKHSDVAYTQETHCRCTLVASEATRDGVGCIGSR